MRSWKIGNLEEAGFERPDAAVLVLDELIYWRFHQEAVLCDGLDRMVRRERNPFPAPVVGG